MTTRATISWDGERTAVGHVNDFTIKQGQDRQQQEAQQAGNSLGQKPFKGRATIGGPNEGFEDLKSGNGMPNTQYASQVVENPDNVLSTIQRKGHEETVILPDGLGETSVGAAIQLGYLYRDPNGQIQEVTRGQQQAPTAQQQEEQAQAQAKQAKHDALNVSPHPPELVHTIRQFDSQFGSQFTDGVLAITIDEIANSAGDGLNGDKLNQWASRAGMEPGKFQEEVNKLVNGFSAHAVTYMSKRQGVDGQAALQWAVENVQPGNLREILFRHIHGDDLTVWDQVAKYYKSRALNSK